MADSTNKLPADFMQWDADRLAGFAEHHYQMGIAIGRAEMLREIADRDIERSDALPQPIFGVVGTVNLK